MATNNSYDSFFSDGLKPLGSIFRSLLSSIAVVISLIDFQPQTDGFIAKKLFHVIGFMISGFFY
ncbi:MAG: hypothetical protein WC760_11795 [Bacteroidia bacterium]